MRVLSSLFLVASLLFPCTGRAMTVCNPSGQTEQGVYIDVLLAQSLGRTALSSDCGETIFVEDGGLEEYNALFLSRGWGDGLPMIPPTPERVEAMVAGYDLPGDFPIARLAPMGGVATVEKIAVNAVMAGCEPGDMPLLVAAVEAVSRPEFDLLGLGTTTNPDAVLMIVSGPLVESMGLNAGGGTFGRGNRANATISRALHLIIQNVGGSRPGVTDMSTLGQPGEFVMFLAENREASPWPSYHTEFGFPEDCSVVAVAAVEGYSGILGIGRNSSQFLDAVAGWLRGHDRAYRSTLLLLVAQDTARMLEKDGWTREGMRSYLREKARISFGEWIRKYPPSPRNRRNIPEEVWDTGAEDTLIPHPFFDVMPIIVAGGVGEKSMILPCWTSGQMVFQQVHLPGD